jgi:hypothetical protein
MPRRVCAGAHTFRPRARGQTADDPANEEDTAVPVTKDMLVSELQNLLRMTAFEQSIATVRRAQARSTDISEELKANAEKSGERLALLAGAVRQVGGMPDVVGPLLGKASASRRSSTRCRRCRGPCWATSR